MSTEAAADLHFYLVGALAAYPEATAQRILEGVDERAKAIEREAAAAAIERLAEAERLLRIMVGSFESQAGNRHADMIGFTAALYRDQWGPKLRAFLAAAPAREKGTHRHKYHYGRCPCGALRTVQP